MLIMTRASFEPTNTTVKRVLLQESQKKSVNRSSLLKDSQHVSSSLVDRSAVHQENRTFPSSFLQPSESKGELLLSLDERAIQACSLIIYMHMKKKQLMMAFSMFKQACSMDSPNWQS
jgi:hypothetical protein